MLLPFATGFGLGLSLIIAIGAQNAFILRQGILRQHVFVLCLICAVSDAILIGVGVAGIGAIIDSVPNFVKGIRLFGAVFLIGYAFVAIRRVITPEIPEIIGEGKGEGSLKVAVGTCLAFTFLNPHVYLDTVLLIGASAPNEMAGRVSYTMGAVWASFVWFFSLGFGARFLQPIFEKPGAWRIFDSIIAGIMLLIAYSLVYPLLT